MASLARAVAEVQGLYGPFSFGEKLLQKIWLRGDFEVRSARLTDGRVVRVVHPGRWNLLGGPDFKSARIALEGAPEVCGDVELHLHAEDWVAHGHARDAAYDRVVLHVVLFPPEPGHVTRGAGGREIPVLALLPLLLHDLEEFAAEDAIESLVGVAGNIPEELAALEEGKLRALLRSHAEAQWRLKVEFARRRVQRLGWEAACHHTALEILGYRFNRAPMLRLAERWSLRAWSDAGLDAGEIFASESGRWSLQGVRPANHPRVRVRQYAAWACALPEWPEKWGMLAATLPPVAADASTRNARRENDFVSLRGRIATEICAGSIGGTRLDNLICDGLLPLHAARARKESETFALWSHWFPGDQPPALLRVLRQLAVFDGRDRPTCHGVAQGLFSWFIQRENPRARKGRGA